MSAIKKIIIDNDELAREFLEDACVLGIQTAMEAHRFIWAINRGFRLDLRYQPDVEIVLPKRAKNFLFPYYLYQDTISDMLHLVYVNKHDGEYLLPELKHFDFLWVLKSETEKREQLQNIIASLRTMDQVQMVAELAGDKIKHKQNLVV